MEDCSMTRSVTTRRGAVFLPHQRDQEAARSNRRETVPAPGSVPATSQWCAQEADDQAAVHHGLLVANMVEEFHGGVLHAACSR